MTAFQTLQGTEVAHIVRGRVRLRIARDKRAMTNLDRAKAACETLPGIDEVLVRPASCSVVALYDPDQHDAVLTALGCLPAALDAPPPPAARRTPKPKALRPEADPARPGHHKPPSNKLSEVTDTIEEEAEFLAEHSHAARAVVDFARDMDAKLKLATNNNVDLKILFPIGLAAVMVLEIGAAAATPMWVTLLLFSMNHFVELHAHDDEEEDEERDAEEKVEEDAASLVT